MDKKIRVGYISPGWPLKNYPNGIVAYIHNIIQNQQDKINAFILTDNFIDDDRNENLIRLNTKRSYLDEALDKILYRFNLKCTEAVRYKSYLNFYANKISRATEKLNIPLNIIEVEETNGIAYFLLKKTKLPIVTRLHGPWFIHGPISQMDQLPSYKLRVFYEGEAIKNSHGVTAPSLEVLNRVRDFYGIPLPNAKVIPNPVLEVPIHKQWQYKTSDKQYILVVARFDLHKGGDLAIEAFKFIAQKIYNIELFFVGPDRGLSVDGKELKFSEYILRFIPEENIKKRIKFLGHCNQDKLSELRKNSLVTMVCSRYENFPLSLLEALSYGCPTVATAVGGIKEIIIDGYNGLLADPECPEDIARKVLALMSEPIKMKSISKYAIETSKTKFSPDVVASQTVEFYRTLTSSK